jgi:signal peptidase II
VFRLWYNSGLSFIWLSLLVLVIDRVSKIWMMVHLTLYDPTVVFPFFNFTLAFNRGAAFSLFHNASGWQHILLGGLAIGTSLFIVGWLGKLKRTDYLINIALNLVLGGALGNLWDRFSYHFVIDFLDFHWHSWHFAIFNVADFMICLGTGLMLLIWILQSRTEIHK